MHINHLYLDITEASVEGPHTLRQVEDFQGAARRGLVFSGAV